MMRAVLVFLAALTLVVAAVSPARAQSTEFGRNLFIETGVGYANTAPREAAYPNSLHGLSVRGRLMYGVTDALGIAVTAQMAWYQPRWPVIAIEVEDENGELVPGTAYGEMVAHTRTQELGLSLVYALDLLRVVPYLSAGAFSLRTLETIHGRREVDYAAVIALELGLDLVLSRHFRLGASFCTDLFLGDRTAVSGQLSAMLRAVAVLGPKKVGRR